MRQLKFLRVSDELERTESLDSMVSPIQRLVQRIPPGRFRDGLHGVWLGHPLHPLLVQIPIGAWLSAAILDLSRDGERQARRLIGTGLVASVPAALAGSTDWAEQHEQQMRVGVVHAALNTTALALYLGSLSARSRQRVTLGKALSYAGLAAVAAGGMLGGDISYRQAGGVNHAEAVPHLVEPGWHELMPLATLADGQPARAMLGEVPLLAVRDGGRVYVLADRCAHMSGPLSDGELSDGELSDGELSGGCVTCPWHGSVFRLADGGVEHGPATAPQPAFETRVRDGMVEVCLPGAG
jgi:nitrite reductase/ring-hydroxylating ferredoxin subunit/uncharacterized membrane protein